MFGVLCHWCETSVNIIHNRKYILGFPGSSVVKNLPTRRRHGFDPWSGKSPCAAGWLSPCATREACHCSERPSAHSWRESPQGNEDPVQPKINKSSYFFKKKKYILFRDPLFTHKFVSLFLAPFSLSSSRSDQGLKILPWETVRFTQTRAEMKGGLFFQFNCCCGSCASVTRNPTTLIVWHTALHTASIKVLLTNAAR